jgi:DNA polymerase-1
MSRRLNLLALPKNAEFMRCFKAPPGQLLMQRDAAAIEPRVLAHFSQDRTLMKVYGPNAWPSHDIYLLAGQEFPGLGPKIRALYDINNPTIEGVKKAKHQFAEERRKLCKPSYLGFLYGIGAETLSVNLEIPLYQAQQILRALDKQFPGKQTLQKRLEIEWAKRGGYIVNGRGRPLPVDFGKKRDLVNRMVQSTAHDCLVRLLYHMNCYRKQHKIAMRPYCPDWHDESIWAVYPDELVRAQECFDYGFDRLNDELNWTVIIKHGGTNYGPDLRVRCEGWDNEKQAIIA